MGAHTGTHMDGRIHCVYTVLRDTVFAHPTLSESLNTLFAAVGQEDEIQMTSQAEMGMKS